MQDSYAQSWLWVAKQVQWNSKIMCRRSQGVWFGALRNRGSEGLLFYTPQRSRMTSATKMGSVLQVIRDTQTLRSQYKWMLVSLFDFEWVCLQQNYELLTWFATGSSLQNGVSYFIWKGAKDEMHLSPAFETGWVCCGGKRAGGPRKKNICKAVWNEMDKDGSRWTKRVQSNSPGSGIPLGFSGKSGNLEKRDLNQFSIPQHAEFN